MYALEQLEVIKLMENDTMIFCRLSRKVSFLLKAMNWINQKIYMSDALLTFQQFHTMHMDTYFS